MLSRDFNGQQKIVWDDKLIQQFHLCKEALKSPLMITIPTSSDHLVLTTDAAVVNKGLGATLFVIRDNQRLIWGFFSFKLNTNQLNWLPCELEALAIAAALNFFSPYIHESVNKVQILTDSKACYEAYLKLCKGHFSASNRVSTFLTDLASLNVEVFHFLFLEGNTFSCSFSRGAEVLVTPRSQDA